VANTVAQMISQMSMVDLLTLPTHQVQCIGSQGGEQPAASVDDAHGDNKGGNHSRSRQENVCHVVQQPFRIAARHFPLATRSWSPAGPLNVPLVSPTGTAWAGAAKASDAMAREASAMDGLRTGYLRPMLMSNFTSACCTSRLARGNAQEQTHSQTSSNYLCTNDALETGGLPSGGCGDSSAEREFPAHKVYRRDDRGIVGIESFDPQGLAFVVEDRPGRSDQLFRRGLGRSGCPLSPVFAQQSDHRRLQTPYIGCTSGSLGHRARSRMRVDTFR
jgi:hypothetical protein